MAIVARSTLFISAAKSSALTPNLHGPGSRVNRREKWMHSSQFEPGEDRFVSKAYVPRTPDGALGKQGRGYSAGASAGGRALRDVRATRPPAALLRGR